MSSNLKVPIIVDLGTSEIKAGFSGKEKPTIRSPNYIGEIKNKKKYQEEQKKHFISEECNKFPGKLLFREPINKGVFTNKEDIPLIFNYIYSKLGLNEEQIKEHPILISEPIHNMDSNRVNIAEILFEKMGVSNLIFGIQPLLSLFSTAYTTGVVLESGDAITQVCSSYEGFLINSSCFRYDYGGRDVTNALKVLIENNNKNSSINHSDIKIFKNIKEKQCYLQVTKDAKDRNTEDLMCIKSEYILPDGNRIELDDVKILAPEILFNNKLNCSEYLSFNDMIFNSISKVDINMKKDLYNTVILSGGNTLFRGMEQKMKSILAKKVPSYLDINIKMNSNPQLSCWYGGNVVSSLSSFRNMMVSKNDWREQGEKILHIKCI